MKQTKINHRVNRHNCGRCCGGFTLPEMLVVICLTALLLSFFLQCFFTIANQHKQRTALLELQDNLSIAMSFLKEDISQSTAVLDCQPDLLSLQRDCAVYYSLGTDQQADEHFYALQGNVFYRRLDTEENRQPMANFIDEMSISYFDKTGQPTTQPEQVCAVYVKLTGHWNDRQLEQEQVVRLAGAVYL